MKSIFLSLVILATMTTFFTGCDKPNYQHPLHRK